MVRAHSGFLVMLFGLAAAGAVQAAHFEGDPVAVVDCDGWQISGQINFDSSSQAANIAYMTELRQNGVLLATFIGDLTVPSPDGASVAPFTTTGPWEISLMGEHDVTVKMRLNYGVTGPEDTYATTAGFACGTPPEPPEPPAPAADWCPRGIGFWRSHPEAWPVPTLTVGGETYDRDAAMSILSAPVRGDVTVLLFKDVVAARLNVLAGGERGVEAAIAAADAYLARHPVFSRPGGRDRAEGLALKDALADGRGEPCADESGEALEGDPLDKSYGTTSSAAEPEEKSALAEPRSWSAVKETYR